MNKVSFFVTSLALSLSLSLSFPPCLYDLPLILSFLLLPPLLTFCSGRKEPVPFNLKDDNMGLGRWNYEVVPDIIIFYCDP